MTYQQALDAYRDERDQAARGLDEIGGMLRKAGWTGGTTERLDNGETRPLAEDPERLVCLGQFHLLISRMSTYETCSIGSKL